METKTKFLCSRDFVVRLFITFTKIHSFFFIRTSNFDAEAERSYIFWRFEAETFLKMFLNLPGIVFQPIGLITVYDAIFFHFWNIIRRTAYAIRKPLLLLHKTSPLVFGSIYIFVHLFFCLSFNVQ